MESRVAALLAWAICVLATAALTGALMLHVANRSVDGFSVLGPAAIIAFPVIGALIVSRRPDNLIGWILCAVGLSFALGSLSADYATYALVTKPGSLLAGAVMAWWLDVHLGLRSTSRAVLD